MFEVRRLVALRRLVGRPRSVWLARLVASAMTRDFYHKCWCAARGRTCDAFQTRFPLRTCQMFFDYTFACSTRYLEEFLKGVCTYLPQFKKNVCVFLTFFRNTYSAKFVYGNRETDFSISVSIFVKFSTRGCGIRKVKPFYETHAHAQQRSLMSSCVWQCFNCTWLATQTTFKCWKSHLACDYP